LIDVEAKFIVFSESVDLLEIEELSLGLHPKIKGIRSERNISLAMYTLFKNHINKNCELLRYVLFKKMYKLC
jgi:hypothetical protein|tara:strand:- start:3661 stop:3876 length:216 start_codon:yes stop_codon:yes gene_type:complete